MPVTTTKAPRGRKKLLLYLDFDGVLHHEAVYRAPQRGAYIKPAGHTLFEHAQLLADVLDPYPGLEIVLSTSWVRVYTFSKAAKRLPLRLRSRVIGATFHSHMNEGVFTAQPRGVQIAEDVYRRHPRAWLALDDDDDDWPTWFRENLVRTHGERGISEPTVLAELKAKLERMHSNHGVSPANRAQLPSDRHIPQDYQSLLMHQVAVRLVLDDPTYLHKVQATLARWMANDGQRTMHLWEQWQEILEKKDWARALEDSEFGRELRQASPVSTLLSQEKRLEIIARVRQMQERTDDSY